MAALLDDAMGGAAWLAGFPVVAVNLNISFRNMLPLNTPCLVRTQVVKTEGRKVSCQGKITSTDGETVFTRGEALFVTLEEEHIRTLSPKARAVIEKMNRDRQV
jgi:acyl-CoA thioesterase FadM